MSKYLVALLWPTGMAIILGATFLAGSDAVGGSAKLDKPVFRLSMPPADGPKPAAGPKGLVT